MSIATRLLKVHPTEDVAAKAKDHYEAIFLSNVDYALLGYDGFLEIINGVNLFLFKHLKGEKRLFARWSNFLNNFKIGAHNHTKGFEFWDKHRDRNVEPILIGDY